MLLALLIVAIVFVLALAGRLGGAHRRELMRRWPAIVFAGAALLAFGRGSIWLGLLGLCAAVLAWWLYPAFVRPAQPTQDAADSRADAEARALLEVSVGASEEEIRRAYRAKIARAHPDRGGSNAAAAAITAARDRLLRRRPR